MKLLARNFFIAGKDASHDAVYREFGLNLGIKQNASFATGIAHESQDVLLQVGEVPFPFLSPFPFTPT